MEVGCRATVERCSMWPIGADIFGYLLIDHSKFISQEGRVKSGVRGGGEAWVHKGAENAVHEELPSTDVRSVPPNKPRQGAAVTSA